MTRVLRSIAIALIYAGFKVLMWAIAWDSWRERFVNPERETL